MLGGLVWCLVATVSVDCFYGVHHKAKQVLGGLLMLVFGVKVQLQPKVLGSAVVSCLFETELRKWAEVLL